MSRKLLGMLSLAVVASHASAALPKLRFSTVASGLTQPVALTSALDGSGRLFITEQPGRVRILRQGQLLPEPFLDLTGRVSCCGERGLLSIAFAPGINSHFYANYTDLAGDTVVARFWVGPNPDRARQESEEIILRVPQPFANHNGGQLAFGPDGYLYIGMGDGGSAGDPGNRAQNPAELLGKMLRIAVENVPAPYVTPPSNPFVGVPGYRPEIWALGLRNPWRFSFDRETGDLWIGDVGQGAWEEVNFQPATSRGGENYGWRVREGSHCFNPDPCSATGLVDPVAEYDHSQGCAVTGGFVYRGTAFPSLQGVYLFGDFCSGRIWALGQPLAEPAMELAASTNFNISAFGEDEDGELYLADYFSGRIVRIEAERTDADLAVALDPGIAVATAPAQGILRATVHNSGPSAVLDSRLEIQLPEAVEVVSLDPGRAACSLSNHLIFCAPSPLGPNEGTTVLVGWRVAAFGTYTFAAAVSSVSTTDPFPENNSTLQTVTLSAGRSLRLRRRLR